MGVHSHLTPTPPLPQQWVADMADAGANMYTFHLEATGEGLGRRDREKGWEEGQGVGDREMGWGGETGRRVGRRDRGWG